MGEEFLGFKCMECAKVFKDDQFEQIIFLDMCSHIYCKDCLTEVINLSYPEVECPCDGCLKKV